MRKVLATLVGVFSLAHAFAQIPVSPPPVPVTPPELATPAQAVETFLEAMQEDRVGDAAAVLDLSPINAVLRRDEGPRRANLIYGVLQRLPAAPAPSATVPEGTDEVVFKTVSLDDGTTLGRVSLTKGLDGGWRFSAETVAAIPALYEAVERRPVLWGQSDRGRQAFNPEAFAQDFVPETLRRDRFLGLQAWQWIGLGVMVTAGVAAQWLVRSLLWLIAVWRFQTQKGTPLALASRSVFRASGWLAFAGAAILVLRLLSLPEGLHVVLLFALEMLRIGAGVFLGLAVTDAAFLLAQSRLDNLSRRAGHLVLPFSQKVVRFVVVALGLIAVVATLGFNVAAILAGLGLGGLVLALAAKDSVENLFGSLTIMLDMPFAVGDWVKIGNIDGIVEEINLRSTRIRTFEDSLITLPNSTLIKASVENMGLRRRRRMILRVPLGRDATPEEVRHFCDAFREILLEHPAVVKDQVFVAPADIGENAIFVQSSLYFEVPTYDEELKARGELILEAKRLADEVARPSVAVAGPPGPSAASQVAAAEAT